MRLNGSLEFCSISALSCSFDALESFSTDRQTDRQTDQQTDIPRHRSSEPGA